MPKNIHVFPASSTVTVGADTIGPIYVVFEDGNVSRISVGTRFKPLAMPHVEVEQGAAAQVPIVRRYIFPDQMLRPLSAGSIVRPA